MTQLLLCTDMDRTVIPNGFQQEASDAGKDFSDFCSLPEVSLAYVTGRHFELMQEAIDEYALPTPDFAITDVGTRIYHRTGYEWHALEEWEADIGRDWISVETEEFINLLASIDGISPQEPEKQFMYKVSFYIDLDMLDEETCLQRVARKLASINIASNAIWSVDETTNTGLLDILPPRANKLHAIEFLQDYLELSSEDIVFSGDSGNDLPVLISPIHAVLVANATEEVKQQAQSLVKEKGTESQLYQAVNYAENDGHYRGGILQGVFHYRPDLEALFKAQSGSSL